MDEQLTRERLDAAKPHLVKRAFKVVADPVVKRAGGTKVTGSHIEGATDCPDCTRGTYSVGGVLVCIQLPAKTGTMNGKPGDIVACGMER